MKKKHADLALRIDKKWPEKFNSKNLLALASLVDQYKELNYSKKRTNTIKTLQEFFANNPRND